MKTQLAWIFGGGSVVALGLLTTVGGCSSTGNGNDAGTDVTTAQDTGKDTQNTNDVANDQAVQDSGGADCKTPVQPFESDAGVYCPFQGDGSTFGSCGAGEHCCDPKSGNSSCEPNATTCTFPDAGGADFQCNSIEDCSGGKVCCLNAPATLGMDQGCSYYFVSKNGGTTCETSCNGQPQICGATSECTTGTCQPVYTLAVWLGVCQ